MSADFKVIALGCLLLASLGVCASGSFLKRGPAGHTHQIYLDGKPFYFMGANAYWLIDWVKKDKGSVDKFFDKCNDFGLKIIRLWAFNHKMPYAWGKYDEFEFCGLDYILDSARRHNIKLVLALGNTWAAYRSPQDFMRMAGLDPTKMDLLDFYRQPQMQSFYRDHIKAIVSRVNTFNKIAYKDDDTVGWWDVFNEPRCPGCVEEWQQTAHKGWMQTMASYLKMLAPNQLVALGTEGYFMDSNNVAANPGAGGLCEGEDWTGLNKDITALDVSVVHVYDRQMESIPPKWEKCDWKCYFNFFIQYMAVHENLARNIGKPLVLEEFNVILPDFNKAQRTAFFQVVYDYLNYNAKNGMSLMGVMFWNAAMGDVWDDGYNIYLDDHIWEPETPAPTQAPATKAPGQTQAPTLAPITLAPTPSRAPIVANTETLTDFLRGQQRNTCAEAAAKWWMPWWTASWAQTVDADAYMARTKGRTVLAVILDARKNIYGV